MKFVLATGSHIISTSENLDYRYFHETDFRVLDKIKAGKSIMDEDFTADDRQGEFCFGLNHAGKPPTLIQPRPRIKISRIRNGKRVIENEKYDDSMNVVLRNVPCLEIFKACIDKTKIFEITLD